NTSRSSTVTVSKNSESARAANRPPMLAPITTAWPPTDVMTALRNSMPRALRRGDHTDQRLGLLADTATGLTDKSKAGANRSRQCARERSIALTSADIRAKPSAMEAKFQIFLILLVVLAGTALLARRISVAPAILLLLAGIALAFVPGMPILELPPELVLLLVLPPLIYSASVAMSWREFRYNLRPIILLAVGCVIFTAFAVAAATHYVLGLPWS